MESILNNKIKEHNLIMDMNKEDAIDYLFTKYYEFENDVELSNYFFKEISDYLFNIKENKNNISSVNSIDKKYLIDAAYKYKYENVVSLKGPLGNAFWVIMNEENFDMNKIKPYMDLIKLMIYANNKSNLK